MFDEVFTLPLTAEIQELPMDQHSWNISDSIYGSSHCIILTSSSLQLSVELHTAAALEVHESQTNISDLIICHVTVRDGFSINDRFRSPFLLLVLFFCRAVGTNCVFMICAILLYFSLFVHPVMSLYALGLCSLHIYIFYHLNAGIVLLPKCIFRNLLWCADA